MHMALAKSRGGDSNESALLAEFLQCGSSHVTHPALESADELVGQRAKRALVRHASFNALRHGLAAFPSILNHCVAVGARFHRPGRTPPSVCLKRAPLIKDGFS